MRKKVKITDKYSQLINNGSAAEILVLILKWK